MLKRGVERPHCIAHCLGMQVFIHGLSGNNALHSFKTCSGPSP